MARRLAGIVALIALILGTFALPAVTQTPVKTKAVEQERKDGDQPAGPAVEVHKPLDSLAVLKVLEQVIQTKDLSEPRKLKKVVEILSDQSGGRLTIMVDRKAFMMIGEEPVMDPYDADVFLPDQPARMSLYSALQIICAQASKEPATFLIRKGYVEIVPTRNATAKALLRSPILSTIERRPLENVLSDLADQSGLTIVLDPGVGKKSAVEITATFRNASLEDALVAVTEMAELKFVVLHQSIYVTTAAKVESLEKEERNREEKRAAVK